MKKALYLMLLLSGAIILVGCEEDPNQEVIDAIPVVIDDSLLSAYYDIPQDGLAIEEAEIEKNLLRLTASYIGGCQQHEFSLIFSTGNTESIPPGLFSIFIQRDKVDTCNTAMTDEVLFDLSPLQERFWYLAGLVTITIMIPGSDPPYIGLEYEIE